MVAFHAVRWTNLGDSIELIAMESEPVCLFPTISGETTRVYAGFDSFETALTMDTRPKEWFADDELFSPRSVHFSDPLVTQSWEVPRIEKNKRQSMFYSKKDFARFKNDSKVRWGVNGEFDCKDCEQLLEGLRLKAAAYVANRDYPRALVVLQHSIQLRRETNVDFDHKTISKTVQLIADIYCLQKDWVRAHHAYIQSLEAINTFSRLNNIDVSKKRASLYRKIAYVQNKFITSTVASLSHL